MKRTNKMGMYPRFEVGDLLWVIKRGDNDEWVINRERVTEIQVSDVVSDKEYVYIYITNEAHHECFVFDDVINAVECFSELNAFVENSGIKVKFTSIKEISQGYLEKLLKADKLVNKFMLERYIRHYE